MNAAVLPLYVRRLSPLERYNLVINEVHRYHVDGVVEGQGEIDVHGLRMAVARAAAANPGIRVRLHGMLGFCRWVDSGQPPEVRLYRDCAWDGMSESGTAFMADRLDPLRGGPVADVIMAYCRDGRLRIVFRAVHAALDGRGMQHWMLEVFRALRGEPLLGSRSMLTDLDVQSGKRDQVTDTDPPAAACMPVVPATADSAALAYVWRRIEIGRNVSHMLAKALVFLAGWARRHGEGDVGFTVPVDYRGLRTEEMGIGNMTGYVRLYVGKDDSPRTVMQQLNQRIRGLADCRSLPTAKKLPWVPVMRMARDLQKNLKTVLYTANSFVPTGGIVSMGQHPNVDPVKCPGFEPRCVFGIPGAAGKLNVLFVNYSDFTVVVFAAPAAYNHQGQLDEMIEAFRQHFSGKE
jgi:hypothetical protein